MTEITERNLLFSRDWIRLAIKLYLLGQLILVIFVIAPFSPALASALELPALQAPIGPYLYIATIIFLHNSLGNVLNLIPILGVVKFFLSLFLSALVASATYKPLQDFQLVTSSIAWLEPLAYALTVTESIFLLRSLRNGTFMSELRRAWDVLILATLFLFICAYIEAIPITLKLMMVPSSEYYLVFYGTWIFAVIFWLLLKKWKKEYAVIIKEELSSLISKIDKIIQAR